MKISNRNRAMHIIQCIDHFRFVGDNEDEVLDAVECILDAIVSDHSEEGQ